MTGFYEKLLPVLPFELFDRAAHIYYPEPELTWSAKGFGWCYAQLHPRLLRQWQTLARHQTSYAMGLGEAVLLWHLLILKAPTSVLEFGTGYSTFIIASYAARQQAENKQPPAITSLEDTRAWYKAQKTNLDASHWGRHVSLVHAPRTERMLSVGERQTYDTSTLPADFQADFCLVDGPPSPRWGGPGREGSVLQAVSLTQKNGWVLLHDALRSEELDILRRLPTLTSGKVRHLGIFPVGKGLAVIEKCT